MAGRGLPAGWEPPAPGQAWSAAPGAPPAPPAAPPVGQPSTSWAPPPGAPGAGPAPPGPPAYSAPATPEVERVGHALGVWSAVTVVGLLLASATTATLISAYRQRSQEVREARTASVNEILGLLPRFEELDQAVAVAAGASGLFTILTAVGWLVWQRRFVLNASAFAPIAPSKGWGTWGWLVPFAGLYLPQSQLANAARVTDPIRLRTERTGVTPPILYCWWVCFSGSSIAQLASTLTRPAAIDPARTLTGFEAFAQADQWAAIASGLTVVAGLLGAATVLVCTARQRRMLRELGVKV